MPDAQSHLGISVLAVTPQQPLRRVGFAAELMNTSWVDWLLQTRAGTQVRNTWHTGKEYMAAGVRGIMGAQATLQSWCRHTWQKPCWAAWLMDEYHCEPGTRALISFTLEANIPYFVVAKHLTLFVVPLSSVRLPGGLAAPKRQVSWELKWLILVTAPSSAEE